MKPVEEPTPEPDLAAGFAAHAVAWAMERGAAPADLPLLRLAAARASQATIDGHVCTDLQTLAAELNDSIAALQLAHNIVASEAQQRLPSTSPLKQAAKAGRRGAGSDSRQLPLFTEPQELTAIKHETAPASDPSQPLRLTEPQEHIAEAHQRLTVADLRRRLLATGIVGRSDGQNTLPLLIDPFGRLYLRRYFDYERRLAGALMARARIPLQTIVDTDAVRAQLDFFFVRNRERLGEGPDWQQLAAALALLSRLTVISGGPGTGKTTSVVAILACLLERAPTLRIALAAPTGKAATRLRDAVMQQALDLPSALRERLPHEAYTVHRLLGVTGEPGGFRHHAGKRLPFDVLVVDEASMLDLALATKLVEALDPGARLILLGDKDQLAAVEAGAVFAELSADPSLSSDCVARLAALTDTPPARIEPPAAEQATPLHNCVIWLTESYRFLAASAIGQLATDINAGRAEAAWKRAVHAPDTSVEWIEDTGDDLQRDTRKRILDGYAGYLATLRADPLDPREVLEAFDEFRVLCAIHGSCRGVNSINTLISEHVRATLNHPLDPGQPSPWYPGRPVLVLRNEPVLKLFNGDVGICLPGADGDLAVYFADEAAGVRAVAPVRLSNHDTAFATTVHKAQGSEFGAVLFLLPGRMSRVLTRELLYTGVTRAVNRVVLSGAKSVFCDSVSNRTPRHSGLIDRLAEREAAGASRQRNPE